MKDRSDGPLHHERLLYHGAIFCSLPKEDNTKLKKEFLSYSHVFGSSIDSQIMFYEPYNHLQIVTCTSERKEGNVLF